MRRVLGAVVSFALVGVLTFVLLELVPGDVSAQRLGATSSAAARASLRDALGLSGSASTRGLRYLAHVARLDLGRSLVDGREVSEKVAERLPSTALLATLSLIMTWSLALPLALWRRRLLVLTLVYALPVPALAIGLLALGAPYGASVATFLCAAVALLPLLVPRTHGQLARALDEALQSDALRTLRAAGATPSRLLRAALRTHALRLVTLVALELPALLSGVVLVESIFGLPGLGLLAFDSLAARDVPTLLGLVLVGAAITIGCTLAVDLLASRLDPRLDHAA
ncbi:MAG: ABC transporter permease [Polyangia bacterium]